MIVKIYDGDGSVSAASLVNGIAYTIKNKADIVQLGFSSAPYDQDVAKALNDACDVGILVVTPAGAESRNLEYIPADCNGKPCVEPRRYLYGYPALYHLPNQITVAAGGIENAGNRFVPTDYTNYSTSCVDIAAPGTAINTTVLGGKCGDVTGCDLAAAFVTGTAALLRSEVGKEETLPMRGRRRSLQTRQIDRLPLAVADGHVRDAKLKRLERRAEKARSFLREAIGLEPDMANPLLREREPLPRQVAAPERIPLRSSLRTVVRLIDQRVPSPPVLAHRDSECRGHTAVFPRWKESQFADLPRPSEVNLDPFRPERNRRPPPTRRPTRGRVSVNDMRRHEGVLIVPASWQVGSDAKKVAPELYGRPRTKLMHGMVVLLLKRGTFRERPPRPCGRLIFMRRVASGHDAQPPHVRRARLPRFASENQSRQPQLSCCHLPCHALGLLGP